MKKITTLSLILLLTGTAVANSVSQAANSFETFWQTFKTAVSKHDVQGVAGLSRFPIEMSYGIPSIKTKAQLIKRYRQVFNEQTDAAVCFSKAKPDVNAENPNLVCCFRQLPAGVYFFTAHGCLETFLTMWKPGTGQDAKPY